MGSPISGTIAEIYLRSIENEYIKQWLDSKEICYYKRYVDIIILYNQNKTQEKILYNINRIYKNLQFKITTEEHSGINFLDKIIHRKENNMTLVFTEKQQTQIQQSIIYPTIRLSKKLQPLGII